MKSPFIGWDESRKVAVVALWTSEVDINKPSAWDLLTIDDEWHMYPLGEVKELARLAGFAIEVVDVALAKLVSSETATEYYHKKWLVNIQSIDEVYVDVVLNYLDEIGAKHEEHLKVT